MTQKEKPKGKSNPFAGYMRPTEEILWQSKEQFTMREVIPTNTILAFVVFCILFVVVALLYLQSNPQMSQSEVILGTLAIFILVGFRMLRRRSTRRLVGNAFNAFAPTLNDHADYAVTSERLFFQRGDDIRALPLEKVPLITVMPASDTRGTLSFGAVFPLWNGVEDAEQVKSIIENAQKEHQKAAKA